jgi:hypothetical protein
MKKIVLGLALIAVVVGLVGPHNVYYGGQVAYNAVRDFIVSRVPDEFKLEVAKKQLADERKKLDGSDRLLARLEVQSDNQAGKVAKLASKMEREERRLTALRNQLPGGDSKFVSVDSRRQDEIAKDLAEGLQSYTTDRELLESEREQAAELSNQAAVLKKAIGERKAMLSTLEKSIVTLESRQATIRLRNGGTSLPSQDSVKEIQGLLQSLKDNVSVEERLFEMRRSTEESSSNHETVISAADAVSQFDALFCSDK